MSAVAEREIVIPYCPRNWAAAFHATYQRWLVLVLHRRAGKTTAILNHHQRAALDNDWEAARLRALLPTATDREIATLMKRRVYWHVMPSYHQAKLTGAWDTLQEISRVVPGVKPNQSEMCVSYPNGNKIQLIGADKPDSLRGPGLSGLSLDEYSQIPANAFSEVLSKALADHVGYCIFSGTIKGTDQLYDTYAAAQGDADWFSLWQNVDESLRSETGATITALVRAMEDDRKLVLKGLMTQAEFDQEWYLSAEAAIKGAFYADQMRAAREQGRIGSVPYDPSIPVDTDWDLGIDAMAIWFSQSRASGQIGLIDYHEDVGGGLIECIKVVREKPYTYGEHWGPHDIEQREISSALTRRQIAFNHDLRFQVTPKLEIADGITAVQALLARCYFNEATTAHGVDCLRQYRKTYQPRLDQFTAKPVHNWASHGADAFRGLAVRHKMPQIEEDAPPPYVPRSVWG